MSRRLQQIWWPRSRYEHSCRTAGGPLRLDSARKDYSLIPPRMNGVFTGQIPIAD
jgi:hypothetical protein